MNTPYSRLMLACCVLLLGASLQAQSLRPSNRPLGLPGIGAAATVPTQRIAQSGPQPADFIVVVVNSEPITNNELRARVLRAEQQLTQQGVAIPPRNELASRMIDLMINERAQLQLARDTGVRVDELMIDQAMQTVAQQNQVSVDVLRRRLQADGLSLAQFRNDLRDQLLLSRLREREVESRTRVSDQEADQFIREQQTAGSGATDINLAQILVAVPRKPTKPRLQRCVPAPSACWTGPRKATTLPPCPTSSLTRPINARAASSACARPTVTPSCSPKPFATCLWAAWPALCAAVPAFMC